MSSTATEIRELKKQISNLENEAKKTVKQGSNVISAPALERFAHNAGETVREFYDDKRDQLAHLRDETSTRIAGRPLTSAAVAFGAGVLLTALLRRK